MNRCMGLLLGLFNFIDERRDMFHKVQKHKVIQASIIHRCISNAAFQFSKDR